MISKLIAIPIILYARKVLSKFIIRIITRYTRYKFSEDTMTSTIQYFQDNLDFISVRERANESWKGVKSSADISWRLHTFIWLFESIFSNKSSGVFVECGTGKGYMALALTRIVELKNLDIQAYLIDTFESDLSSVTGDLNEKKFWSYASGFEEVSSRFKNYKYCHLVKGKIPKILDDLPEMKIDLLHIDLNHAESEFKAIEYLLPKMNNPSFILLDDYAFHDRTEQGITMNSFARNNALSILTLTTGQGLIYIR
jgi:hypothetical protein